MQHTLEQRQALSIGGAVALTLAIAGCSDDGNDGAATTTPTATAAATTTAAPAAAPATSESATTTASTTVAASSLTWTACQDAHGCSTLEVPKGWDQPDGEKIELALIRLPAEDPEGVGVVNWGGPGAPGLTSIVGHDEAIQDATGGKLDIVAFDPRGLNKSTPIACNEGNDQYFNSDPATPGGLNSMFDAVAQRAQACAAKYGDYLGLIGTTQVVHDLDAIREALGQEKLTFSATPTGRGSGRCTRRCSPTRSGGWCSTVPSIRGPPSCTRPRATPGPSTSPCGSGSSAARRRRIARSAPILLPGTTPSSSRSEPTRRPCPAPTGRSPSAPSTR